MKILLVSANPFTTPHPVYPLGLDHVAGAIDPRHELRLCDVAMADGDPLAAASGFTPDLVGVSIRNIDNCDASDPAGLVRGYRELIDAVRARWTAPVVLGGAGFTIFPVELLNTLGADYGVIGEGERFGDLVEALDRGEREIDLPGVIRRGSAVSFPALWNGRFSRALPDPDGHAAAYLRNGGILNLQTARGCPYRCIYCTYPAIEGKRLRKTPPDEIGAIARGLQDAGARFLFFTDSVFNADTEHSLAVGQAVHAAGVTIPWGGFFSPRHPTDGYYRSLREAGLTHIEFGTDTFCAPMLKAYAKPFSVDDVFAAHAAAIDAGVHVAHFFALGGPGETAGTLDETLTNVEQLDRCAAFFFAGLRIFPGTPLHRAAVEEGQIAAGDDLLEPVFYRPAAIGLDELLSRVETRGDGRIDWVVGSGGDRMARLLARMYERGHTGPLWERLIR